MNAKTARIASRKRKISNPAGEDEGDSPQPRGVGSAKRTQSRNLGQPGGFVLSTSSAQQAAMGRKGGLSCNLTSVLRYVWVDGWMDGNGSHVLLLGNAFYVCSYIYCTWDG